MHKKNKSDKLKAPRYDSGSKINRTADKVTRKINIISNISRIWSIIRSYCDYKIKTGFH